MAENKTYDLNTFNLEGGVVRASKLMNNNNNDYCYLTIAVSSGDTVRYMDTSVSGYWAKVAQTLSKGTKVSLSGYIGWKNGQKKEGTNEYEQSFPILNVTKICKVAFLSKNENTQQTQQTYQEVQTPSQPGIQVEEVDMDDDEALPFC